MIADLSQFMGTSGQFLMVLVAWTLVWKGLSLWRAARKHHTAWFVILLLVNTAGLLEILYYFYFNKLDNGGLGFVHRAWDSLFKKKSKEESGQQ